MSDATSCETVPLHEAVAEAMQEAWDDFVSDTGCFPDCFTLGTFPNRTLSADFQLGNFARLVAMWLEPRLSDSGAALDQAARHFGSSAREVSR